MSQPEEIVARLLAAPLATTADAGCGRAATTGAPSKEGYYAWWCELDAAPTDPPHTGHPSAVVTLLYVGVAPRDAVSNARLRLASAVDIGAGTSARLRSASASRRCCGKAKAGRAASTEAASRTWSAPRMRLYRRGRGRTCAFAGRKSKAVAARGPDHPTHAAAREPRPQRTPRALHGDGQGAGPLPRSPACKRPVR
jgi:hypothetical protein